MNILTIKLTLSANSSLVLMNLQKETKPGFLKEKNVLEINNNVQQGGLFWLNLKRQTIY